MYVRTHSKRAACGYRPEISIAAAGTIGRVLGVSKKEAVGSPGVVQDSSCARVLCVALEKPIGDCR